jgi:hypothetical protein
MRIRVQYNDAKRLLIIHNKDQLMAVYRDIDWVTAHTIRRGLFDAETMCRMHPEKTLVDFLNELNDPPTDEEWNSLT